MRFEIASRTPTALARNDLVNKPLRRPKKTFLITAGPTVEPIDPVRFISNYSTGAMGYELAKAAQERGHRVILISGPTALRPPKGAEFVPVKTAREMAKAASRHFRRADCVIMAAAVADFRPAVFSARKLKKSLKKEWALRLARNPDILSGLAKKKGRKIIVGFGLETDDRIKNAEDKMKAKNMDIIVANKAGRGADPFGCGRKDAAIISRAGGFLAVKGASKRKISHILLDKIDTLW
jgi:phosphopantothenoylcysteine decarboxylase/phosphopantothenate--cysteine ligase